MVSLLLETGSRLDVYFIEELILHVIIHVIKSRDANCNLLRDLSKTEIVASNMKHVLMSNNN